MKNFIQKGVTIVFFTCFLLVASVLNSSERQKSPFDDPIVKKEAKKYKRLYDQVKETKGERYPFDDPIVKKEEKIYRERYEEEKERDFFLG